jgi:hypothetical protein
MVKAERFVQSEMKRKRKYCVEMAGYLWWGGRRIGASNEAWRIRRNCEFREKNCEPKRIPAVRRQRSALIQRVVRAYYVCICSLFIGGTYENEIENLRLLREGPLGPLSNSRLSSYDLTATVFPSIDFL